MTDARRDLGRPGKRRLRLSYSKPAFAASAGGVSPQSAGRGSHGEWLCKSGRFSPGIRT